MFIAIFVLFSSYCFGQQQNNTVIIQQNTTPVVIEKPVYIERYRTVYVDKPQPKRVARKLPEPILLLGYLWVYPEDLGTFKQQPLDVIKNINAQNPHGPNNWRIPTSDELAVMEANADKIGLGDDIYLATDHSNGVLRLVSTGKTTQDLISTGQGVEIGGIIWATADVGMKGKFVDSPKTKGNKFSENDYDVCPKGWRLPTKEEFEYLLRYYHSTQSDGVYFGVGNNLIFLPFTNKWNSGASWSSYWSSSSRMANLTRGTPFRSRYFLYIASNDKPHIDDAGTDDKYQCRCVLEEK